MTNIKTIDKAVMGINMDIINMSPKIQSFVENYGDLLEYRSDGNQVVISFLGIKIWNDEDDPREYDDEKDTYKLSIEEFVRDEIREVISALSGIRIWILKSFLII